MLTRLFSALRDTWTFLRNDLRIRGAAEKLKDNKVVCGTADHLKKTTDAVVKTTRPRATKKTKAA